MIHRHEQARALLRYKLPVGVLIIIVSVASLATTVGAEPPKAASSTMSPGLPPPGVYELDPPHTFVYFNARHRVVGLVRGRFDKVTGTVTVTENRTECAVEITIDTASLSTQNADRDQDLRGADFFSVKQYPVATYRGKGIRPVKDDAWLIDGNLSIRGVDKKVPLTFVFKGTGKGLPGRPDLRGFHATAGTRRADFGMTRDLLGEIGSGSPSEPDVTIEIDTELIPKK